MRYRYFQIAILFIILNHSSAFTQEITKQKTPPIAATSKPLDIVNVQEIDSSILVDLIYNSSENFVGTRIDGYHANICYLTQKAALALHEAQAKLQKIGKSQGKVYSLLLLDCYRPQKAVDHFVRWVHASKAIETKQKYYPDLAKEDIIRLNYISPVSGHTRASSVDITLVEIEQKGQNRMVKPFSMGSHVDFFGESSHTRYPKLSPKEQENRALLLQVMEPAFHNYPKEWWHFVLKNEPYPKTSFHFDINPVTNQPPKGQVPTHSSHISPILHLPATPIDKSPVTTSTPPLSISSTIPATKDQKFTTYLSDPQLLEQLDQNSNSPLSLVTLFTKLHQEHHLPIPSFSTSLSSTNQLDNHRSTNQALYLFTNTYGEVSKKFSSDIAQIGSQLGIDWEKDITKTYLPSAAKTESGKKLRGNGNVTRIFNETWLRSADGQFLLAGVIFRLDRKDFDGNKGSCGEVRFIYRLGYEVTQDNQIYASRMPFTFNMVYEIPNDGKQCKTIANQYQFPPITKQNISTQAELLLKGPLDISKLHFQQIELNAQVARFPSDLERMEGRKFAGQAIYLMRIFRLIQGRFQPIKLENTPDVLAIQKDPVKQKLLKDFLRSHLEEIDLGVYLLPENLLADVALSYSTSGSLRTANKPFDLLLSPQEADEMVAQSIQHQPKSVSPQNIPAQDVPKRNFVSSGRALLERLNTSTCMGCHQSSSTAGFHFLGVDRTDFGKDAKAIQAAIDGNQLELPFSPHFLSEVARREYYLSQVAKGLPPNLYRPHPSAPSAVWQAPSIETDAIQKPPSSVQKEQSPIKFSLAQTNMPCLAQEKLAPSSSWSCEQGSCQVLVNNPSLSFSLGQCIPKQIQAGISCRAHDIIDHTAQAFQNQPAKLVNAKPLPQNSLPTQTAFTLQTQKQESLNISQQTPQNQKLFSYNIHSFQDHAEKEKSIFPMTEGTITAQEYNCRPSRIGVPLGRVTRQCRPLEKTLETSVTETPLEICAIVGGKGFEEMAKGYFNSRRFAEGVGRGLLDTCSPTRFCKEDYICQQMPHFLSGNRFGIKPELLGKIQSNHIGFCTPTYFVYQLRLDGHPNPR